jgi:penicillin-binding protein 2
MKRLYIIGILSVLFSAILIYRLAVLKNSDVLANAGGGSVSLTVDGGYGNIYDRNFVKQTNNETIYQSVFEQAGKPVLAEVTAPDTGLYVFETPKRYSNTTAVHILGYNSGETATGIERAYRSFLESKHETGRITFPANAKGQLLDGLGYDLTPINPVSGGVILTLDANIGRLVREAAESEGLTKGAVVIMNMSGDIIASESFPDFDPNNVEDYLGAPDAPLFNRVFAPFAVGSVFKLTAAAEALRENISPDYTYNCRGYIDVKGVRFNCHSWAGHGVTDIHDAIVYSCNPFFIALGEDISLTKYHANLKSYGFGVGLMLAPGFETSSGNLPTLEELRVPAERANLSFGQGKLTASPFQICRFTAAIANGGLLPSPRLVMGITDNIETAQINTVNPVPPVRVMSEETARFLSSAMFDTIKTSVTTAIPVGVTAAGKTSTAQTGQIKADGSEIVHVWFTGFFPYENPEYAVTVIAEDGISGTLTAAPVFREIAERLTRNSHKNITK